MNCKKCGAILNEDDLFCSKCGNQINDEDSPKNNISNTPCQNPNVKEKYGNYDVKANQYAQQYGQYNNYNSTQPKSGKESKVILIIILVIVFLIIGVFLGKALFGGENNFGSLLSGLKFSNSSYIVTENHKKVTFKIANTLKEDKEYSDKEQRCFEKTNESDYFTVWVREGYRSVDDYMKDLEDRFNNSKYYKNVQASEIKERTVNGKKFYYRFFDYDMEGRQFKEAYFVYELEKDSLYNIIVEQYDLLTDEELEGLLRIECKDLI